MRFFVDTNVFLRHVLQDHPDLSPRAQEIMRAIERGEIDAWTSDLVIAEIVFVLSGKRTYNLPRQSIAEALRGLLALSHLKLPEKRAHLRALSLFAEGTLDYPDAFDAALMYRRRELNILSFDTDFDGLPEIIRHASVPVE